MKERDRQTEMEGERDCIKEERERERDTEIERKID